MRNVDIVISPTAFAICAIGYLPQAMFVVSQIDRIENASFVLEPLSQKEHGRVVFVEGRRVTDQDNDFVRTEVPVHFENSEIDRAK